MSAENSNFGAFGRFYHHLRLTGLCEEPRGNSEHGRAIMLTGLTVA